MDIRNAVAAYTGKLPSKNSMANESLKVELLNHYDVIESHRHLLTPYMPKVRRYQEMMRQGAEFPPIVINTLIRDEEGPVETLYEGRHRLIASAEENVPIWAIDVAQIIE